MTGTTCIVYSFSCCSVLSVSPFPLPCLLGRRKQHPVGRDVQLHCRWKRGFGSSLPLASLIFLNLTAPVKPAANDLQVGQRTRDGQWPKNLAECLLFLLLTTAWIFSVFLPLYHFFSLFSSVEALMFFLSLSCVCQGSPSTLQTVSIRATQLCRVLYPFYEQVDTLKNREIKGFVSHHSASLWQ